MECPVRYFISAASPSLLVFTDARNPIPKSQLEQFLFLLKKRINYYFRTFLLEERRRPTPTTLTRLDMVLPSYFGNIFFFFNSPILLMIQFKVYFNYLLSFHTQTQRHSCFSLRCDDETQSSAGGLRQTEIHTGALKKYI